MGVLILKADLFGDPILSMITLYELPRLHRTISFDKILRYFTYGKVFCHIMD